MKVKLFPLILVIAFSTIFSRTTNVPKNISTKFLKLYPTVTKSLWDKEGNNYKVDFKKDGKEMSVVFNIKGKVVETETAIKKSELPFGVEKFVSDLYPEYKISESSKINKSTGEVLFATEITKGKIQKDLLFDENSKILKDELIYRKEENEE